jgi:hypothetical protein
MLNFSRIALAILLLAARAQAEPQAQGFALERLYPAPAGAGWLVLDDLDVSGGLGGATRFTLGYAYHPLVLGSGPGRVSVGSSQLDANLGGAVTYQGWRFSLDLGMPLLAAGQSGSVAGYSFTAPSLDLGSAPDTISDVRIGSDVRIFGAPGSPLRFGASAQLYIPSGKRADYDTDGTFRAMIRALAAGDEGHLSYAGELGVHIRPLDDSSVPGSPRGSELLFGVAVGPRLPMGPSKSWTLVVGPEIFGAAALRSLPSAGETACEGLLSGRMEITADQLWLGVDLGAGAGLDRHFGAPDWRLVVGIDLRSRGKLDGRP